ncbi:hypothetical protein G6F64_003914 [Rhizopus arrhizus]|uniref:Uncharacterized protein n=1 Tax=Rhizopus oryzae TaxID=64495 RepID=A0A9P7BU92_RHIOR|nr:hypothetical protein G6F64_003914 [Rhizopus arrhizus]
MDDTKRHSLKITAPSHNSFKQRVSSLFGSSPVMNTIKESFHKKPRSSTDEQDIITSPYNLDSSSESSLKTNGYPHPTPSQSSFVMNYKDTLSKPNFITPPTTPSTMSFDKEETRDNLAYQVYEILGSTMDEVDREIDQDWEVKRTVLQKNLLCHPSWTIQL